MGRKKKVVVPEGVVVWRGPEPLRALLVPVTSVKDDPGNANSHDELSYEGITASYARFSQHKPIVVSPDGVVKAGNGQLEAARRLGWTHIAAVTSDLPPEELELYALADNQTPKRAIWDYSLLKEKLQEAQDQGLPIDDLGWQPHELAPILQMEWTPPPSSRDGDGQGERADGQVLAVRKMYDRAIEDLQRRRAEYDGSQGAVGGVAGMNLMGLIGLAALVAADAGDEPVAGGELSAVFRNTVDVLESGT